jgi:hypothetical protein
MSLDWSIRAHPCRKNFSSYMLICHFWDRL